MTVQTDDVLADDLEQYAAVLTAAHRTLTTLIVQYVQTRSADWDAISDWLADAAFAEPVERLATLDAVVGFARVFVEQSPGGYVPLGSERLTALLDKHDWSIGDSLFAGMSDADTLLAAGGPVDGPLPDDWLSYADASVYDAARYVAAGNMLVMQALAHAAPAD